LLWVRNLGRRALGLLSGLLLLPLPLGDASASRLGLLLGSRLGFLLQRPLGLANLLQPGFPLGQFRRQFVSPPPRAVLPILGRVDGLGLRQQLGYFLFQFLFCLAHPFIAHRLVLGRVGFDLRPVQRYVPQLHQPRGLTQLQNLLEQSGQRLQVTLAKLRQAVVIRMLIGRQHPIGNLLIGGSLDLPRRGLAHAVGIQQEFDHHRRMKRRLPATVAFFIGRENRTQVQLIHHIAEKQSQVPFGKPIAQGRRQKKQLLRVVRSKDFHGTYYSAY